MCVRVYVEPLLKDIPNKGQHRKYLSTKEHFWRHQKRLSYGPNAFSPLKRGEPIYSGQFGRSQCVLYTEVSLYIDKLGMY